MNLLDCLIGASISLYRVSPLYPSWGPRLARVLARRRHSSVGAPAPVVLRKVQGFEMALDLGEVIDSQLYYTGTFEAPTLEVIRKLVRAGDTAVDVGANIGWITLNLARQVGPTGRVLAFEPSERAFHRLAEHVSRNQLAHVETFPLAIGDETSPPTRTSLQSSYRIDGLVALQEEMVSTVRLDDFVSTASLRHLDFIKVDTDGMEPFVFRGARAALERFHPILVFEFGPAQLAQVSEKPEDLLDYLEGLGYGIYHERGLRPATDVRRRLRSWNTSATVNLVGIPAARSPTGPYGVV